MLINFFYDHASNHIKKNEFCNTYNEKVDTVSDAFS